MALPRPLRLILTTRLTENAFRPQSAPPGAGLALRPALDAGLAYALGAGLNAIGLIGNEGHISVRLGKLERGCLAVVSGKRVTGSAHPASRLNLLGWQSTDL